MKGAILVIGGKPKGDKMAGGDEPGGNEGGDIEDSSSRAEARKEASRAIIRAVKMSDPDALDKALEAHYEACEGMGGDEGDEE